MAMETLFLGAVANDRTGDNPRDAGGKINRNFAQLAAQAEQSFTDMTTRPDYGLNALIPYGSTSAKATGYSRRTFGAGLLAGTSAIVRHTPGSGTFGPANSDYSLLVSASKDDWQTSLVEGELNTLNVLVRQGQKGDVSSGLIDIAKRRNALTTLTADETGAALQHEAVVSLIDASGTAYHVAHSIPLFAESPGGVSGGRGFGHWNETFKGTWYSGYHAGSLDNTSSWIYYFTGAKTRSPADLNFSILADARIAQGFPSECTVNGYNSATGNWELKDQAGALLLAVGRTSGIANVAGGMQVGGAFVVDTSRHIRPRVYSRAALPTPTATNIGLARVSNPETGHPAAVYCNGSTWTYEEAAASAVTIGP